MKKLTTILLTLAVALCCAGTASAKTTHHRNWYVPRAHHACRAHYRRHVVHIAKTRRVRRHGKLVTIRVRKHGHVVKIRQVRCVRVKTTTVRVPVAPTPVPPTPTPTPSPAPVTTRAAIDPAYTQDPNDALKVTWTYSADGNGNPLPAGTLALSVQEPNAAGPSGGCTMNVDATTTGGTCTVELPTYGAWNITVTYAGSGTTVVPATSTDTEMIEPLPATIAKTWGSDSPSSAPSITATVIGSTADVSVSDQNFEGASTIAVSDQLGDDCTATVSDTTATCDMTVTGTPTRFQVAYPGGTTMQGTRLVAPNGTQQLTTTWPAQNVAVTSPSVTVQAATIDECGGYGSSPWYPTGSSVGCGPNPGGSEISGQWPNPATVTENTQVEFINSAIGNVAGDQTPAGYLTYTITGPADPSYEHDQDYGSPNGSEDCSMVTNDPGLATGACAYKFDTPGEYTLTVSFTSQDDNYASVSGQDSETIEVLP